MEKARITREEIQARKDRANNDNTLATFQDNLRITGDQLFEGVQERAEAMKLTVAQTKTARTRVFQPPLTGVELYVARQRQLRGCPYTSFQRFV